MNAAPCFGPACVAERLALTPRSHRFEAISVYGRENGYGPHERNPDRYRQVMRRAREVGPLTNPRAVGYVMAPWSEPQEREHAWLLLLDIYAMLQDVDLIAIGQRDRVAVNVVDALRAAWTAGNRYNIFAHNHPTGYAMPSTADQGLTDELAYACAESGLYLLDSVVLGIDEIYSFREGRLIRL